MPQLQVDGLRVGGRVIPTAPQNWALIGPGVHRWTSVWVYPTLIIGVPLLAWLITSASGCMITRQVVNQPPIVIQQQPAPAPPAQPTPPPQRSVWDLPSNR